MTSTIRYMTPDNIRARREQLLTEVGMDADSLKALGELYQLTPEQAAALRELESLEFLAGE